MECAAQCTYIALGYLDLTIACTPSNQPTILLAPLKPCPYK